MSAAVVATYKGVDSAALNHTFDALAPELFTPADTGSPTFYDYSRQPFSFQGSRPASANRQVYLIAAGLGPTNPAQVTNTKAAVASPTPMPVQ